VAEPAPVAKSTTKTRTESKPAAEPVISGE
jgi:hypothetical protein